MKVFNNTIVQSILRYFFIIIIISIITFSFVTYPPYSGYAQLEKFTEIKTDTIYDIIQDSTKKRNYELIEILKTKQNKGVQLVKTLQKETKKSRKNKIVKRDTIHISKINVLDTLKMETDTNNKILIVSDSTYMELPKKGFCKKLWYKIF